MAIGSVQMPDLVGGYAQGFDYGQAKAEQKRRQPIVDQLERLKMQQAETSVKSGEQRVTLQDLQIQDATRKRESADMADFGQGAAWARNQPDSAAAWEQVLDQYESEGKPVQQFRGRADLMPMISDLNNPDYAAQQSAQQNLQRLIRTAPAGRQELDSALSGVKRRMEEIALKNMESGITSDLGDYTPKLDKLTGTLTKAQRDDVFAASYSSRSDAASMAKYYMKENAKEKVGGRASKSVKKVKASRSEKPKNVTQAKAEGFYDRMRDSEVEIDRVLSEGYEPTMTDRYSAGGALTNWMASDEGQQYWNAATEWTRSKLRAESGAVIGVEEAREEARTYFPVAGDSDKVKRQKERLRDTSLEAMRKMGAVKKIEAEIPIGFIDNGNGTFTMPNGTIVERD